MNPTGGGPTEGVRRIDEALNEQGHKTDVVCLDPIDHVFGATYAGKIIALGPVTTNYGYTPKLVSWLREHASEYDAVIVNGLWQYTSFAAWRALAGSKTPYFVFTHGMLDPWFKNTYPLKHLKKWLYWPWAEYRVLRDARSVIFTCEEERLLARESFWLYKATEAVTSYGTNTPPQDAERLSAVFLEQFPECKGKRLVLFLSRIHEKKGCDLLIEAFAKVAASEPRLHLFMAGPDQTGWATGLKAQANRLGLADRITWSGMIQGDMKWGAFHACEVFCLPSHQENFGIVVAEALACGKPVLISDKVNIWREIEGDKAGIVGKDDLPGTLNCLESWLALSPTEYADMSVRAKQCFESRFQIQRAAVRLIEIIEDSEK